ncbi:MAG TPA: lysophospholipid acyltransferase family protein [Rhodothermales bacterium]|nr:lysophospholipid acyltransferase family protein [Rhodothermales bacterium]
MSFRSRVYQGAARRTPSGSFAPHSLFVWGVIWATLVTIPLGIAEVINYRLHPVPETFKKWARRWGITTLWGLGIGVAYAQEAPLDPKQPYVFVANHQNAADILALSVAIPHPFGFVAKSELAGMPVIGSCIRHSPSLFVDKSTPRRAVATMQEAGSRIRQGTSVLIFAEGARSFSPMLLPFQRGAFQLAMEAGVPLVPVTITDGYRVLNEKRRVLWPGTIHVVAHAPIQMRGRKRSELPDVMNEVHRLIQSHVLGACMPEKEEHPT